MKPLRTPLVQISFAPSLTLDNPDPEADECLCGHKIHIWLQMYVSITHLYIVLCVIPFTQ